MANEAEFIEKLDDGVFRVDHDGSIWRLKQISRTGRAIKIEPRRAESATVRGYKMVKLGKNRSILAHRAVYVALVSRLASEEELNHLDGRRDNNAPSNLEIATRSENVQHSYDVLGRCRLAGEANGSSKLTQSQVDEIRSLDGVASSREVGRRFGVSKTSITRIWSGERWTNG